MFNDADRLAMLKAVGAEPFDTGQPSPLWAVLEGEFNDPELTGIPVEGEDRWLECRISDQAAHNLVKKSRLVQTSTGRAFYARRFEPNASSGFLVIRLSK